MRANINLFVFGLSVTFVLALILTAKLSSSSQPQIQSGPLAASSASTEGDVKNVIAKASASVVQIEVTYQIKPWFGRQQTHRAMGSGFVISSDSHCHVSLITNSHVLNFYEMAAVEQRLFTKLVSYTVRVKTPAGLPVAISEVYDHREHDAALLIAQDACDALPALTVAKHAAQVGDEAIALGYPLGMPLQASKGIVSSLVNGDIGTDAAIHPGSSGGPLLNRQGEVIGITTYGIAESAAINFAQSIGHLTDTHDYVAVDFSSIRQLRRYLKSTYR